MSRVEQRVIFAFELQKCIFKVIEAHFHRMVQRLAQNRRPELVKVILAAQIAYDLQPPLGIPPAHDRRDACGLS